MASRARSLLEKAGSLTWPERLAVLRTWFVLPVIWLGLRLFSLPRLLEILNPKAVAATSSDRHEQLGAARRAARVVNGAARLSPFPSSCLTRSIALWRMLGRRGVPAEIRLGVQSGEQGFAAHAWVEVDGQVVNEPPRNGERFAAFPGELLPRR